MNEISPILEYPIDEKGRIVTRRADLAHKRPPLDAPPPSQPGSVDWTVFQMFGSIEKGVQMIESIVAGQGENAHERWTQVVLLYRTWEQKFLEKELPDKPTLNQVCHALRFDAAQFISELRVSITDVMTNIGRLRATMAVPQVVDKVIDVALSDEGDTKDRELALKLGGMIEEKGGVQVNVNQQQAVVLKGEKDRMKAPLLQFSQTVEAVDDDIRSLGVQSEDNPKE